MPATVEDATGVVLTLKLAVVAPCGTVTDGGTVADALLLERAITILAVPAPVSVTVPVEEFPPITLVGLTVIEESAAGGIALKVAPTDFTASMVTLHAPVPLHAPLQPAKAEPVSGVAAKLTTAPFAKLAEHVVPQEIPAGELATVPVPVPLLATVRVNGPGFAVKFALTDFAASMVTLHAPVPLHAPLQPANVEPESGVAVKSTTVPFAKLAEHVAPQEIPEGALVTVPVPVPLLATVRVNGPGLALKFALTDFAASMVTLHAPVPLQAPPQPANVEPESGVAAKFTTVPLAKLAEHVVPQEIPEGVLVTAPVPVPLLDTVRVKGPALAVKVAPTDLAASMVTVQAPVPVQAPLQPANVEPESGVAVRFTTVPLSKLAEHVAPQEIPDGELARVPVPVPLFVTVRVKDVGDAPVINLLRTFVVAC
jgi:hypothetical protein